MPGYETFGEIKTSCAIRAGHPSVKNLGAQEEAELDHCINATLKSIHNESRNRFLRRYRNVRLGAMTSQTTGAAITKGSTTVSNTTQAAVFTSDTLGSTLLLNDEKIPYIIVELGANQTSANIFPAYVGDDLATAPFKILNNRVLFDDDVMSIVSVIDQTHQRELRSFTITEMRSLVGNPGDQNVPTYPSGYYVDSTLEITEGTIKKKKWSLALAPMNSAQVELMIDYYKVPADLVDTDDIPDIPKEYRHILVDGAWVRFAETLGIRDTRALEVHKASFRQGLKSLTGRTDNESHTPEIGSYRCSKRRGRGYRIDTQYADINIL